MAEQSNDKIYDLINAVRLELKADIAAGTAATSTQVGRLDERLTTMEEKRIAPLEKDVTNLKIKAATTNVKLGVISFIGSTAGGSIIGFVLSKVLR